MSALAIRNTVKVVARPAVTGSTRFQLQSTSSGHNNDPEVLDREKRRNLSKQPYQTSSPMDDAPGWNETLATSSEAHVKADRATMSPEDLVSQTVKHVTAKHSSEERMDSENAMYDRDEVEGPLRKATKETHTVIEEKVEKF